MNESNPVSRMLDRIVSTAPWVLLLLLLLWTRHPSPGWLLAAAAGFGVLFVRRDRASSPSATALAGLVLTLVVGFVGQYRLDRIESGWVEIWEARRAAAEVELGRQLGEEVERAGRAARDLANLPASGNADGLFAPVRAVRQRGGVTGAALVGLSGELIAWDGEHRGPFPQEVAGVPGVRFLEGPLFSYLYVTEERSGAAGTAVVALLLHADLPLETDVDLGDFASRFRGETGEEITLGEPSGAPGAAGVRFPATGTPLIQATVVRPPAAEVISGEIRNASRRLVFAVGLVWLLLAWRDARQRERSGPAAATLVVGAAVVPWLQVLDLGARFQAGSFVLPGPLGAPLGQAIAVTAALVVAAGLRGWLASPSREGGSPSSRRGRHAGPIAAVLIVAVGFPVVLGLLLRGGSAGLLAGNEPAWIAFQWTACALLALAGGMALWTVREPDPSARGVPGIPLIAIAPVVALALTLIVVVAVTWSLSAPLWLSSLWAVPFAILAVGVGVPRITRLGSGALWALTILIGASAALPITWGARVETRARIAEAELQSLESESDPYLVFLLSRYTAAADSLDRAGASVVGLLYGAWRESGLAELGHPLWIELWGEDGLPVREVRFGAVTPHDETDESVRVAAEAIAIRARSEGTFIAGPAPGSPARYVAAGPLAGGRVISIAVFARRSLAGPRPLGSLLALSTHVADEPLTLVPLLPTDPPGVERGTTRWLRSQDGWQAERVIDYPEGTYHALYTLRLPGPLLRVARGTLLLSLDVGLFLLLWGVGRFIAVGRRGLPGLRPGFATSFRARVSAALFGFFLISILLFATLAFQSLTRAGERTAVALAENIVENVARSYPEVSGGMLSLARRLGSHLLEYKEGRLHEGSEGAEELVELGLYDGWLPPEVFLPLSNRERLLASSVVSLGSSEYTLAYRRLPDGDVVATPVSLEAGAVALRRREVTDLLLFALLAGASLSLGLAILVGRAFARPIQTLQIASERVGSGNLDVRLPEERRDEFGSVFLAFNRMVESLDRARRDLLRTSRRTRAILEEAATGVVAVDAHANVTLVNPRAEAMLGCTLDADAPIRPVTPASKELARWVEQYFRQSILEATTEIQAGDRRIRVRGRRIAGWGAGEGAVFSLEDVTDELRSERILAWGEMARQVAHEVKNPLTPIRLSVQHVKRAWEDRRPEFGPILSRNVDAILREIDRLAAIASSFSKFGAPGEAGEAPVSAVDLPGLLEETLALYVGGEGPINFRVQVEGDIPQVQVRPGELKEVLVNLLENARTAVGDDGTIEVRARFGPQDERVLLEVADDGDGIAAEVLPRIFEPHFSTRSAGTGLGLAIVRRLVESWGGSVDAESRPGEGTRIRMHLVPAGGPDGTDEA